MRLPFRRRPRFTNPPEVIPLVVVGIVALRWLSGAAVLALHGWLVVAGWNFVRRLVAGWFRRQPPEPFGPAA